jgi:hypothetical protein
LQTLYITQPCASLWPLQQSYTSATLSFAPCTVASLSSQNGSPAKIESKKKQQSNVRKNNYYVVREEQRMCNGEIKESNGMVTVAEQTLRTYC